MVSSLSEETGILIQEDNLVDSFGLLSSCSYHLPRWTGLLESWGDDAVAGVLYVWKDSEGAILYLSTQK